MVGWVVEKMKAEDWRRPKGSLSSSQFSVARPETAEYAEAYGKCTAAVAARIMIYMCRLTCHSRFVGVSSRKVRVVLIQLHSAFINCSTSSTSLVRISGVVAAHFLYKAELDFACNLYMNGTKFAARWHVYTEGLSTELTDGCARVIAGQCA